MHHNNDHTEHLHLLYSDTKNKTMLYIHQAIKTIGIGLIGVFLPIILYQDLGTPLSNIFFFFSIYSLVILLGVTFTSSIVSKYGSKINMLIGVILSVVYFGSVKFILDYPDLVYIIPIIGGLFSIFFWTGFHFDMADAAKEKGFGKKVATLNIVITFVSAITPLIGGFIVDNFGSGLVLYIASFMIFLSGIPLLFSSKKHKEIPFSKKELKSVEFGKIGLNAMVSFGAVGYLESVVMVVWPILLFISIGSFSEVGIIVSFTSIILIAIMYFIGRVLDKNAGDKLIKSAIIFSTGTWLSNIVFILMSFLNIFLLSLMDIFNQISKTVLKMPLTHKFYKFSEEDLSNPMYGVIIHEIGIHGVKFLLFLTLGILFHLTGNHSEMLIYPIIGILFVLPFHYAIFKKHVKNIKK